MGNPLRNSLITALTLFFLLLCGAAVAGWLKPAPFGQVVARLEPFIFVTMGYCFGRLPSQQNEKLLKEELASRTQRADAAQHAKEQMQQARDTLEEKMKNVRSALTSIPPAAAAPARDGQSGSAADCARAELVRLGVATALKILNS